MISHNLTLLSDNKYTHFMSLFSLWRVWVFYNKNINSFYLFMFFYVYVSLWICHMHVGMSWDQKSVLEPRNWSYRELCCVCRSWWLNLGLLEEPSALFLLSGYGHKVTCHFTLPQSCFSHGDRLCPHTGGKRNFLSYAVSCWQTGHRKKVNLTAKTF